MACGVYTTTFQINLNCCCTLHLLCFNTQQLMNSCIWLVTKTQEWSFHHEHVHHVHSKVHRQLRHSQPLYLNISINMLHKNKSPFTNRPTAWITALFQMKIKIFFFSKPLKFWNPRKKQSQYSNTVCTLLEYMAWVYDSVTFTFSLQNLNDPEFYIYKSSLHLWFKYPFTHSSCIIWRLTVLQISTPW